MAMMPSPDLDHSHPDFHDLNWCISSSLSAHEWINQSLINYNDETSNYNEHLRGLFTEKEIRASNNRIQIQPPSLSQLMAQDNVGFPGTIIQDYNNHGNVYLPKIKEEFSQQTLPRFSGGVHEHCRMMIDEKLLARALQNNLLLPSTTQDFIPNNASNANFQSGDNNYNMVLPSVNLSSGNYWYSHPVPLPGTLDMDLLHAFDGLNASRLNAMPSVREDAAFGLGPTGTLMQQLLVQGICTNQSMVPSLLSGVAGKRGVNNNSILENKTSQSHQDIPRKSRLEPRSPSFSSFKVRKEKLGDRIAALQQLVAPFGKTLSVPYLRSPKSKKQRTSQEEASELEKEEEKLDLRSRGLCLVPLSCTSYVTNENGGVWSSPNFGGSI
ncbi:basic helix-loop-helix (bHLH) DNA-binding superfamily protein isoform X2 [Carex rostrata]